MKFGIKPKPEELKELLNYDHFVQLIAITEGDFDLLMVRKVPATMAANTGDKYVHWGVETTMKLLEYRPVLNPFVPVLTHIGFTPILSDTIKKLDLRPFGLDDLDKRIIIELNENSRLSYEKISKRLNVDVGTVRYRIRALLRGGIIRKFTILLTKPPTKQNIAFMVNYELSPGIMRRYNEACKYYNEIDKNMPLINKFQYIALTLGSNLLYGIGCFDSEEKVAEELVKAHKEIYRVDKMSLKYAKITEVIKGYLPVRNVDINKEFRKIDWHSK